MTDVDVDEWPKGAPGSDQALDAGCTCPVIDNGHGRGQGGDGDLYGWWVNEDCPIHHIREDATKVVDIAGLKIHSTEDLA